MSEALPDVPAEMMDRVEAAAAADGLLKDPLGDPPAPTNDIAPDEAPSGAGTEEGTTAEADSFTHIDPNTLPEELRPFHRQLQGDYTRKTQEAAPWRKLAEELGVGSPDEIREAVQLYAYLQDPANLSDFNRQLSEALGAEQPQAAPPPAFSDLDDDLDADSPAFAALRNELADLRSALEERDRQAQAQQLQWAMIGEINRQEALLQEQHPEYKQEDWDAIYGIAPAFGGDLIQAANLLESYSSHRVGAFLNGKSVVQETQGIQPAPVRTAEVPRDLSGAEDPELRGATQEAREYIRGMLSASE